MNTANIDEQEFKELLKAAMAEALLEHRDLMREIVEEAMEDLGLERAINQGLESDTVPRTEVFALLEGAR
jgi:hypothetical protein